MAIKWNIKILLLLIKYSDNCCFFITAVGELDACTKCIVTCNWGQGLYFFHHIGNTYHADNNWSSLSMCSITIYLKINTLLSVTKN